MRPASILIVGCGDIGRRLATRLLAAGHSVTGVVRSAPGAAAARSLGITPRQVDLDQDAPPTAAEVYWLAPPPAEGHTDPRLRHWLAGDLHAVERVVYVSTSGVYGDCQGRWIDEDEPARPRTARGHRRWDAERALADAAERASLHVSVVRVPGIYGPGRLPLQRLQQGLPVVRDDPEHRHWTNRIHAEDLADALLAAMRRGRAGATYHASDGHPSTMADYFRRCARLLGLPEPPEVDLATARDVLSPALLSFLGESKRLRNNRLRGELGLQLRYPDLEAGLPSCIAEAG